MYQICIVDDEDNSLNQLKEILLKFFKGKSIQVDIFSFNNPVNFIDKFIPNKYDIIFLDISMPQINGIDVGKKIREKDISTTIVFTTSLIQYALSGYEVNAFDYLLKPIGKSDIEKAFHKLEQLHGSEQGKSPDNALLQLIHSLKKQESYKTHFLIPVKGDKLLPISVDMILLFYIQDCKVKVVLADGKEYTFPQTLDEITECIDPSLFFRVNRQFLISREAIKDIDLWFNNRLSINLRCKVSDEKVLVSKARVQEFKDWFSKTH